LGIGCEHAHGDHEKVVTSKRGDDGLMVIVVDVTSDDAVWQDRVALCAGDGSEVVLACGQQSTGDV
jgi:hypothetical protein